MNETTPNVIFELTGPYAGDTLRIGGFDFQQGELHVSQAEADRIESALSAAGIPLRRKRVKPVQTAKQKRK